MRRKKLALCLAAIIVGSTLAGCTVGNDRGTHETHVAPKAMQSYGGGCAAATAEEMGTCVGKLFEDPASPYSPKHDHSHAETQPLPSPRIAGAPAQTGVWRIVADAKVNGQAIRAIHVSLMKSGKVLVTAGSGNDPDHFAAGTFLSFVWDMAANSMVMVPTPKDLFCSGHLHLPDGRLFFFGGTTGYPGPDRGFTGSRIVYTFDEAANKYIALPQMTMARWYPSGPADAQGNPIVVGGADERGDLTDVNETYNVAANQWRPLGNRLFPLYPQIMLAGNGRLFYSGVHVFGRVGVEPGMWEPAANGWQPVGNLPEIDCRDQGAALFMYPAQAQKVMTIGGGCSHGTTGTTAIADIGAAHPAYVPGPPLPFESMHICGLNLPDGSLFAAGGGDHNTTPVLRAAILKPGASAWEEVASPSVQRMYHSTCILAPDGAVLTFGTDIGKISETRIERYEPWYMGLARPTLTSSIGPITWGGTYEARYTSEHGVRDAMLVRPSSATHSSDPNQRAVKVPVTVEPGGVLQFAIEPNRNILPPGPYMLFLLDERGVPSEAQWTQVGP